MLREAILRGLKKTINEHGPITKSLIGSAAKRISGEISSEIIRIVDARLTNQINQKNLKNSI